MFYLEGIVAPNQLESAVRMESVYCHYTLLYCQVSMGCLLTDLNHSTIKQVDLAS